MFTVYVASCPECGKKFNLNSAFRDHMRIHTGEKPFGCDLCDQAFPTEAGLSECFLKRDAICG